LNLKFDETDLLNIIRKQIEDSLQLALSRETARITTIIETFEKKVEYIMQQFTGFQHWFIEHQQTIQHDQIAREFIKIADPQFDAKLTRKYGHRTETEEKQIADRFMEFYNDDPAKAYQTILEEYNLSKATVRKIVLKFYDISMKNPSNNHKGRPKDVIMQRTLETLKEIHILITAGTFDLHQYVEEKQYSFARIYSLYHKYLKWKAENSPLYQQIVGMVSS
jgi:hypothetical protein